MILGVSGAVVVANILIVFGESLRDLGVFGHFICRIRLNLNEARSASEHHLFARYRFCIPAPLKTWFLKEKQMVQNQVFA